MSKQARLYLIITFIITWSVWFYLAYLINKGVTTTNDALGLFLYFLGGSASTYVAYIAIKLSKEERIKDFHARVFKFSVPVKYYIFALFVPIGIVVIGQGFYYIFNQRLSFEFSTINMQLIPLFFISSIIFGGIEEFGWRGIIQESLFNRYHLLVINLLIGTFWTLWHLPIFFMIGQAHYQTSFLIFLISCIGYSSFMTYLYAKTRSVIIPIIFHTMINTIGGSGMFVPMSAAMPYLAMSIVSVIIGSWLLLQHQKQLNMQKKY
jgi:membrane protease YdiL (CAAX protease family)